MITTVGQLAVNMALPEEMRDWNRVLDGKGVTALFQQVAEQHPDKYREIAKKLSDIGRDAAYTTGGFSFGLKHLRQSHAAKQFKQHMATVMTRIMNDKTLSDSQKEQAILQFAEKQSQPLEDAILRESQLESNPLALQISSKARGNPGNLRSLRGADILYVDHHDRRIPVPVVHSYSEGLTPAEYWAGTYGARKGVHDTKKAVGDAGFLAKQLAQVSHRLVVTADDFDEEDGDDSDRQYVGLPSDVDDADNVGALLSLPVGGYARNTVITPKILQDIRRQGVKRILVRSPLAGIGPRNGGVFAKDVGHREYGRLPTRGDMAGLTASQALAERLTQGSLSSKHSGGVAGAAGNAAVSGFKYINQLVQTPKQFRGGATHAQLDGRVQSITEAPQGGQYVTIGEQQHYVPPELKLLIQPGQEVEAGDVLSEGIPNPAEITAHKHVGEGRRYFAKAFYDAYQNSGIKGHRRNVELLARGLVDHVKMTDELGDFNPDDIVPYSDIARSWQAREDSVRVPIRSAVGMYLEKPILHHSIGTPIKTSMLNELRQFGVKDILVNKAPPPFQPVMIRAMGQMNHDPDFMTRFLGSNLQKSTLDATHRGLGSDLKGTSYVSALAEGSSFGRPDKATKPKLF